MVTMVSCAQSQSLVVSNSIDLSWAKPAAIDQESQLLAKASISSWLKNNRSVASLEYTGEVRLVENGEPDQFPLMDGAWGESSSGSSYRWVDQFTVAEDDAGHDFIEKESLKQADEGGIRKLWDPELQYCHIGFSDDWYRRTLTPMKLLGERTAPLFSGSPSLGSIPELLLASDNLFATWIHEDESILLEIQGHINNHYGHKLPIRVLLDPSAGFCPREIIMYWPGRLRAARVLRVEDYVVIDDVYIPSRGSETALIGAAVTNGDLARFDAAVRAAGLDPSKRLDLTDAASVAVFEAATLQVFGMEGFPSKPHDGLGSHHLTVRSVDTVNQGLSQQKMISTVPEGTLVADMRRSSSSFFWLRGGEYIPASSEEVKEHLDVESANESEHSYAEP